MKTVMDLVTALHELYRTEGKEVSSLPIRFVDCQGDRHALDSVRVDWNRNAGSLVLVEEKPERNYSITEGR